MPGKCHVCKAEISNIQSIKCSVCNVAFHLPCVKDSTGDKKLDRKGWKCEGCTTKQVSATAVTPTTSDKTGGGGGRDPVLAAIAEFRKETQDRLSNMEVTLLKLNQVESDMKLVTTELGKLKEEFSADRQKHDELVGEVVLLKEENKRLNEELINVKRAVCDLQQHSRKCNILITGVPVTTRKNVYGVLEDIARLLNVNYHRYDVSVAHRLAPRDDNKPPSIVVCFVSRTCKNDWLEARRRRKKLSAVELRSSFPDTQIYLNEHLTPEVRTVFNATLAAVKRNLMASVWTSDCRVIAKQTVSGRPFWIRDLDHLERLKNAAARQQKQHEDGKENNDASPPTPPSTTQPTPDAATSGSAAHPAASH